MGIFCILFEIVWFFSVCYTRITTFYEWRRRMLFPFFYFTLKRTLGYYYGNDQNTTKTIKSRLWLCSNCQLYTFHSVLYVFSERKTGYLMPPYALAIHSSGSVLQEWWSAPKASLVERSYLFLCLFDKDEYWKIWFCGLKYDNRLGTKEIKYSR